jgi:hypothetical protein
VIWKQQLAWCAAAFLVSALPAFAQPKSQIVEEIDLAPPEVFPIFPWDILPAKQAAFEEARQCGFNLAGFVQPENLDLVAAAGMKCFVSDPSIEIRGKQSTDEEIAQRVKALAERTAHHPATFGYHVIDEPPADLVPAVVQWTKALQAAAPDALVYVNLLPGAGKPDAWEKYLHSYVDAAAPKAFSYDFYSLFDDGAVRDVYFSGLEIARKVSIDTKTPFWHVALANSHFRYADPTAATFRFQVFTSLAYGVRGVGWFTYTGRDRGNYRNTAIDLSGRRTPTYDLLRDANLQMHRLAPIMTKLKSVNVFHHPQIPQGCKSLETSKFLADVKGAGPFCVGEFEDEQGRPAVLVVNRDMAHSTQFNIVPKSKTTTIQRVSSYTGKIRPWGAEDNWLAPGDGILLLLHD